MKLSRGGVALYVALIFFSGLVLGALGHRLYTVNSVGADSRRSPDEWRKRYTSEMQSRLHLSAQQVGQLNTILDETRTAFHQAREKMRPEMESIREMQFAKIRAILDNSQKAEYEKMRAEREKNMKKLGSGPGF